MTKCGLLFHLRNKAVSASGRFLIAIICFSYLSPVFAGEQVGAKNLDVVTKELNDVVKSLGGAEITKEQLRVTLLDSLIADGSPKKHQNPEGVRREWRVV
jgi:hypothetical protein